MAGQPTQAEATALGKKAKSSMKAPLSWSNMNVGNTIDTTKSMNSNRFPDRLLPSDSFDTEYLIRQQLVQDGTVTPARPLFYTEKELEYLKKKRDAEEFAAYQVWLGDQYNLNNPADQEFLKELAPSYFSRREKILEEQNDLQLKYAKLRLKGPETEEDLKFEYLIETGRIDIPNIGVHEPMNWLMDGKPNATAYDLWIRQKNAQAYQKGLFNPLLPLTYANAPLAPNRENKSDIRGVTPASLGPYGAHQPYLPTYSTYSGPNLGFNRRNDPRIQASYDIEDIYSDDAQRVQHGINTLAPLRVGGGAGTLGVNPLPVRPRGGGRGGNLPAVPYARPRLMQPRIPFPP